MPGSITSGPDGNIWFVEQVANKIGRVQLPGKIDEFSVPTAMSVPTGITGGPDGNVWFTEFSEGQVGTSHRLAMSANP